MHSAPANNHWRGFPIKDGATKDEEKELNGSDGEGWSRGRESVGAWSCPRVGALGFHGPRSGRAGWT